jgi:hypothetical protein
MTCTHAALKRRELVELGFKVSNVKLFFADVFIFGNV